MYQKEKLLNDPVFKLRMLVSGAVFDGLHGKHHGKSIIKHLPYTMKELKKHLEDQFEPWMNWNNHKKYNPKTWDDNDKSTWVWNLDHIIPHSTFKYDNLECDEFFNCWNLTNLRPYSAKQNIIDGGSKIRHK